MSTIFNLDTPKVVAVIVAVIDVCVGFCVNCNALRILKYDWNKTYIVKRHRILLVTFIAICITIQIPCVLPTSLHIIFPSNTTIDILYRYMATHLSVIMTLLGTFVFSIRTWLLYFDLNLSKYNSEKIWLSAIDPTAQQTNWFYNRQQTFGNANYLMKHGVLVAVFITILHALLRDEYGQIWGGRVLFWTSVFVSVVVSVWCWIKLKPFYYDSLAIRKELIIIVWFIIACVIAMFVIFGILEIGIIGQRLFLALYIVVPTVISIFMVVFVSILPRKWNQQNNSNYNYDDKPNLQSKSRSITTASSPNTSLQSASIGSIGSRFRKDINASFGSHWKDIVCTTFGFENFMNYLQTELSTENLLFVSEVCIYPYINKQLTPLFFVERVFLLKELQD